jgi:hypothetical protein
MASYNLKYNSDDSVVRHTIIGLLADLNNKVYFYRQLDANTRKAIDVPFYYSISGDDQFLRDNFLFSTPSGPDCHPDAGFADGNYDVVPRGVVQLSGMSIDSGSLVNKRNIGTYTKMNEEGAMEGYTAEFEMIPITLSLNLEILVSSTLDSFKITERIIKTLYKSNNFEVEVGHLNEGTYRLNAYYAIPDDFELQNPIDFTWEDKEKYKISFPIEVNTFIPAFDFDSERHVGNRMFEILSSNVAGYEGTPFKETLKTTENGTESLGINKIHKANSDFNSSNQTPSTTSPGTNNIKAFNSLENPGLNLIPNGSHNQEIILISTQGSVEIDTSNFAAATSILILEGGVLNIKFFGGNWYITGSSNTTINY